MKTIRKWLRRLGGAQDTIIVLRFSADRKHVLLGVEQGTRVQWAWFQEVPGPGEPIDIRLTDLATLPKGTTS